jgi:SOS response regulatory protein OraA/RecX
MSWDGFKTMNDLMKYRIGFTLPKEMTDKSKMSQYMPNGFSSQPIFSIMKYTKDAVK